MDVWGGLSSTALFKCASLCGVGDRRRKMCRVNEKFLNFLKCSETIRTMNVTESAPWKKRNGVGLPVKGYCYRKWENEDTSWTQFCRAVLPQVEIISLIIEPNFFVDCLREMLEQIKWPLRHTGGRI